MGETRFTVQAVWEILFSTEYRAKLHYKPAPSADMDLDMQANTAHTDPDWCQDTNNKAPAGWKTVSGDRFGMVHAVNTKWSTATMITGPRANMSDGFIDLHWAEPQGFANMVSLLLGMEDGSFIDIDEIKHTKTLEFVLTPLDNIDLPIDLDGERINTKPTHVKMFPSLMSVAV